MFQRFVSCLPGLLVSLFAQMAVAQTATVEVTIQTVRPEAKEITVTYTTSLGEKSITLDVSRKAEITLNGEAADLDALGPGQQATLEYHKELAVVTRIIATGEAVSPPELLKVSELVGAYPWLSEDGLTVYWEQNLAIWTAHRDNPNSYFTQKKELVPGRHPTVSGDGLEMVFLTGPTLKEHTLHVVKRNSLDASFPRAKEIPELRNERAPKNPSFSSDGLTLYFNSSSEDRLQIVFTTRASRTAPWTPPKPLPIQFRGEGGLTWPFLTQDGLTMYCSNEGAGEMRKGKGNQMIWSRASVASPFSQGRYIQIEGLPALDGRCPRYVAATGELFFQDMTAKGAGQGQISVIRNFSP